MTYSLSKDYIWHHIIRPILWPCVWVQVVLVVLSIVVAVLLAGGSPAETSWLPLLTIMAIVILGSGLNLGAFVLLLRARARRTELAFEQRVGELEQKVSGLGAYLQYAQGDDKVDDAKWVTAHVLERLKGVIRQVADIRHRGTPKSTDIEHDAVSVRDTLLDDLAQTCQQLNHLQLGRDRARQESRLKSGYLSLLRRETSLLFNYVDHLSPRTHGDFEQDVSELKERLADMQALLGNLVDELPAETNERQPPSVRRASVLVVDDGPVNLMLAKQVLDTLALEVTAVDSGNKALAYQQYQNFDLVFMDIFMPGMDGLDVSRRWRRFEQIEQRPPSVLVALTANADEAGRERCLQAGMNDLIAKPYQPEHLINCVATWLPDDYFSDNAHQAQTS